MNPSNLHCPTLEIPANEILEMFGRMFFDFCQDSGYDSILRVLGATTKDFLQNLDALHDHLATIYPGMKAPSFRCSERMDGSLILHYYSERAGLEHIVIGIVKVSKQSGKRSLQSKGFCSLRSFGLIIERILAAALKFERQRRIQSNLRQFHLVAYKLNF